MSVLADQRELASPAGDPSAKRRRVAAQRIGEAEEHLTSTSGTGPAFDYAGLPLFARNRISASLVILLVLGTLGFLSSLWTGAVEAGPWTSAVLLAHAVIVISLLACRLYFSTHAREARAEKDALIAELEASKAISEETRRRAEAANIAKSRFLAQMSHELRTPLNAILGFSEVMKGEIFGPHHVPAYRDYAGDIHNSGVYLLGLINQLLDLSRIETGRYELDEEPVALARVVGDCAQLLQMRAARRGLTIYQLFEADMPPLWADARAVRQISLNLLGNAIKFTPQGGEIRLKAGWTASGGQYVSVKDTGPGIPEEEIPIVLASFGQGSNSIKSAEQGAGLGLPIAKSLIDLHGGTFRLKSTLRTGTEVIIAFPPERVMSQLASFAQPVPSIAPRHEPPDITESPQLAKSNGLRRRLPLGA